MSTMVISSLLFLSLSLLSLLPTSTSEPTYVYNVCDNSTTFASNSNYHRNLNTVFRSLSSNATDPGSSLFYATSAGAGSPDAVYGLFLCRGDQNATACRDCISVATSVDLPAIYCPNRRVAIIYYDQCMVRYSNHSILGNLEQTSAITMMNTRNINGNTTKLNLVLMNMMNELANLAAGGDKLGKKFAVKQVNFTMLENLYGLVQCTPDLSGGDCRQCLNGEIPKLLVKKQGAQSLTASCIARYETYPFYNGAANFSPPTRNGTSPVGRSRKKKISVKMVATIVVPVVVVSLAVLILCIFCCINGKSKKHDATSFGYGEDLTSVESLQYDLGTLQYVTNNFSDDNKLGEGGFGSVYKGKLPSGQEIAVKRLSGSSGQGVQEFKNEVLVVAKLRHRNLVRLLGFCLVGEEKLLVYEYVLNKSLDYFLFDSKSRAKLDWGKRQNIILGIARGMLYLHQDSGVRIIHRDLKASNILLDANMNPKISDFGMAMIFDVDQTQGNTSKVVGTYGYMAPEYAMHGQFSDKSDVYSFGVLVLEIISGKKNSTFYKSGCAEDLLSYTWKQWREGTYMDLVDPIIRGSCSSNEVMRYIHLGLLCVQELVVERPTMATSVLMLDSNTITFPVPQKPAFFVQTRPNCDQDVGSDKSMDKPMQYSSVNDVSISDFEPR